MPGVWARFATDSIRIRAFDDFLDVRIAATQSDSALGGAGVATSDAELVRDSSGRLRELHREWAVAGRPVACDSLPAPAISSGAPRSP